jgi:SOS-response transcriptional repressor LexA
VYSWLNNESPEIYDYNQSKIAEAVGTTAEVVAEALELAKSGVYEVDANRRLSTVGRPTQVKARGGEFDTNVEPYSIVRLIAPIPTFDLPIAAGAWADVSGQIEITDARQIEQGLFRVHVRGDSMQPKYPDGCIVEFRIVRRGRDGWPIGKNCYVQLASGDATFKRMEAVDEDTVTLVAINSAKYKKPLTAAVSDVVSMAVAMGTFSPD